LDHLGEIKHYSTRTTQGSSLKAIYATRLHNVHAVKLHGCHRQHRLYLLTCSALGVACMLGLVACQVIPAKVRRSDG
jgi:hypothetical protein